MAVLAPFFMIMVEFLVYLQVALGMAGSPLPSRLPLDPAKLMPAKSLGFITLSRDAALNQSWQKSLASLSDGERAELTQYLTRNFNLIEQIGFKREALATLGRKLAHLHFCFDGIDQHKGPSLALLLETVDEQTAKAWIKDPGALLDLQSKPRELDREGMKMLKLRLKSRTRLWVARQGHVLVISGSPHAVARYVGLLEKQPAKNLAGTQRYKQSMFAGDRRPSTGLYVDVPNILDATRGYISRSQAMNLDRIDSILGLSDMGALVGGLRTGEQGTELALALDYDAESTPLTTLLPAGKKADPAQLALLPASTGMFFGLALEQSHSLVKLKQLMLKAGKEMETNDFEEFFGMVKQFLGDPLETVTKELNGQALIGVGQLDLGAMLNLERKKRPAYPGPPLTFVVGFKDPQAGMARWKKVSKFVQQSFGGQAKLVEKTHGKTRYLAVVDTFEVAGAMLGHNLVVVVPGSRMPAMIDRFEKQTGGLKIGHLAHSLARPSLLRLGYSLSGGMMWTGMFVGARSSAMGARMGARRIRPGGQQKKPFKPKKVRLIRHKSPAQTGLSSSLELARSGDKLTLRSAFWGGGYARDMLTAFRHVGYMQGMTCQQNYRQLYLAYQKYRHVKEAVPASFVQINAARNVLQVYFSNCPAANSRRWGRGDGYLINPKPDANLDQKARILFYDHGQNHVSGRFVMFADGNARWVKTAEFAKLAGRNALQPDPKPESEGKRGK